jgi:protein-L-isoaspartate(D-aspartate) O-methyltransferase
MLNISDVMSQTNRAHFLPRNLKTEANVDAPISIGYSQTNSQPTVVKMMLEWLQVQPGHRVLDVGSGSGWTTALLSKLVGKTGRVYAVEKVPALVKFGRHNCQKANCHNVRFFEAENTIGLIKFSPYDRILVSASAERIPHELLSQLKVHGIAVIPVDTSIQVIKKMDDRHYESTVHEGYRFVPLT